MFQFLIGNVLACPRSSKELEFRTPRFQFLIGNVLAVYDEDYAAGFIDWFQFLIGNVLALLILRGDVPCHVFQFLIGNVLAVGQVVNVGWRNTSFNSL